MFDSKIFDSKIFDSKMINSKCSDSEHFWLKKIIFKIDIKFVLMASNFEFDF